ncbi:MAG: 2OG-Fe(II) oxygenase [Sphingomonadaceae bacterium]|nr:2OG-Fe(II) oxygenase [Sphingomonadaceae bacterium]
MSATEDSPVSHAQRQVGRRSIHLFDGVFDPGFVTAFALLASRLPYLRTEYDSESSRDFLHLKHEWQTADFPVHPLQRKLWQEVDTRVTELYSASAPSIHRIHANDAPYGDYMATHTDSAPGVTAVYFANSEWRDEWQGELILYDGEEPVTAVAPRPGRLVIFPGDIPHRAGVPARTCPHSRITLAFKYVCERQTD